MGIIGGVIFVVRQHHPFDQFPHICKGRDSRNPHEFSCSIYANGCRVFIMGISLSKEFGKIESYQLSVRYFPSRSFFGNWKEELNRFDTNGFSQVKVTFKTKGPGLEVTNAEPTWYSNKTSKISSILRLGLAAAASLLIMGMGLELAEKLRPLMI